MEVNTKIKQLKNLKLLYSVMEGLCMLQEINDLIDKTVKNKRKRSCSVRKINRDRNRNGFYAVTFLRIKEMDSGKFFIYTRMNPELYNVLLELIGPLLKKYSIREPISPECRLALVLQYLTQGASIQSLAWSFKLGKTTCRQIIFETCEKIWTALYPVYVAEPNVGAFKRISKDFWNFWNMPNCVGSIDGKHIAIRCPPNSGSQHFSYTKHFSIVLMAVCDAKYTFTHIDIGAYGSQSDGGIFHISRFGRMLLGNSLPMPDQENLPGSTVTMPHYFVGDSAFPLSTNLMRPYPGTHLSPKKENFNKRLSRARRTIENSFGILVARWRILLTTLHMLPENAETVVLACVALPNFIMLSKQNATSYSSNTYTDWEDAEGQLHYGSWRSVVDNNIPSIEPSSTIHQYGGKTSTRIRNNLCEYLLEN